MITIKHSEIMAQNEYTIKVELRASKQEVWKTITNFRSYDQWNTVLIMNNNDRLEIGKKFKVTIIDDKSKQSKFKALVLTHEPNESFSARQTILGKWFFSATHHFIIHSENKAKTTFEQTWDFTGILYKPFKKIIFKQLKRFNQMNTDLKTYLER